MGTGLMRKGDEGVRLVSATVLPSPFPEELFLQAYRVQQDINSLIVAASRDHDFITSALKRWDISVVCCGTYIHCAIIVLIYMVITFLAMIAIYMCVYFSTVF